MKHFVGFSFFCALFLMLTSCGTKTVGNNPGYGPFDSQGRYREDWADDPSKWRRPGKTQNTAMPAAVAKNEQPLPTSSPYSAAPVSAPKPKVSSNLPPPPQSRPAVRTSKPETKIVSTKPKAKSAVAETKSKAKRNLPPPSKSKVTSSKTKPTSKSATSQKSKPKGKVVTPKATRYTVKKGDTLSGIASRYGASVSKIRSANGLSGSVIRPGQSLSIPK